MVNFDNLCQTISVCKDCDLYYSRKNAVCGEGTASSGIMIVGEAPGQKEDLEGKPFIGRSGKLLDSILSREGLSRSEVYISNAVRCRPKIGVAPKVAEIKKCSKYLKYEIESIKPRIIVPMGNSALKAVGIVLGFSFPKVTEISGKIYKVKDYYVIPQFHPAAILRNPKKLEIFKDNFVSTISFLMGVTGKEGLSEREVLKA